MVLSPTSNPANNPLNPFGGLLDATALKIFTDAIDSLVADDGCTVPCTLAFGDTKCIVCNNCVFNTATQMSGGAYKTGGPIPFKTGGLCPLCNGRGKLTVECTEENIKLLVIWDARKFQGLGRGIVNNRASNSAKKPTVFAQTMSRVEYYPKLNAAKHIILNTDVDTYNHNKYKKITEGEFCGLSASTYVIFTWQLLD